MTQYKDKDAAKDTNAGGKETARAWHSARDDWRDDGKRGDKDYYHTEDGKAFNKKYGPKKD